MPDTATQTLADFLLSRIAEDEATARRVGVSEPIVWGLQAGLDHYEGGGSGWVEVDPGRVLAECEAKRRIMDLHQRLTTGAGGAYCPLCDAYEAAEGAWSGRGDLWPCPTLVALAQPYADHPGFREEWRADA